MRKGQRRARSAAQPALDGAVPADLPAFIKPQLATEVSTLPEGEWMLQGKLDGYRLMVRIDGADVRLLTRNGHDWTRRCRCSRENSHRSIWTLRGWTGKSWPLGETTCPTSARFRKHSPRARP